jgi:restriction system protein
MNKPMSRSRLLIAAMHRAALGALAKAPGGQLTQAEVMQAIQAEVPLDDWAREAYENNGNIRWRSIFGFASVGLIKAEYLTKANGIWTITPAGRDIIQQPIDDWTLLNTINRLYRQWKSAQISTSDTLTSVTEDDEESLEAPEEHITQIINVAHQALAAELINTIKTCDAAFFETLVVQLLLKMGYGGSRQEAGKAVGRSGDGGIDGIINEDRLGLDAIYLQAKRWEGSVGESPIRDFKGALDAKGAQKGVFITTSTFTPAAKQAAHTSRSYKIVLIDGARLAELMIEHNLGVSVAADYQLKRIDSDFFSE